MPPQKRSRAVRPRRRAPAQEKGRTPRPRAPKRAASATTSRGRAKPAYTVAEIVAQLNAHRQRATYAAVGGLRGAPAVRVRGWFAGREAPENSFVVSRISGEPTGYAPEHVHRALKERADVIESTDALRAWLGGHTSRRR